MTILYVEDDEGTRNNLFYYLNNSFQKVLLASNGLEGWQIAQQEPCIDLIISDIHMPKMDGLQMIQKIKSINPKIPFLLTTAYNDQEYLLEAIELGVVSYVVKPIDITLLFEKLRFAYETIYEQQCLALLSDKMSAFKALDMHHFSKAFDKALDEIASKRTTIPLCNGYQYDFCSKNIVTSNQPILLNNQEIKLIEYLIAHKNEVVSYTILTHIMSTQNPSVELVRTIVKSIRKKTTKNIIVNLSGVGYKIGLDV